MAAIALTAAAQAQEAPVTRAEFAGLFASIARGYIAQGGDHLPKGFTPDQRPITKEEVARAMLTVAAARGRAITMDGSALAVLKSAKILPESAALFSDPGINFRPSDLVKAIVAFADGMSDRHKPTSATERALTTPKIGR